MNLPNKLTVFRILLIPFFMLSLYIDDFIACTAALAIFAFAALTDLADGKIARKYGLITNFGKFADPIADKLLTFSALCVFTEQGKLPAWVLFIILAREFIVTGIRLVAVEKGIVIAAAFSGKLKTAVQFVCIALLLVLEIAVKLGAVLKISIFYNISAVLMTAVTLYSGLEYAFKNREVFADR